MPDRHHSTQLSVAGAQQRLGSITEDLLLLDQRLGRLVAAIPSEHRKLLPGVLRAGVECVRTELLSDMIATLQLLSVMTERTALEQRTKNLATDQLESALELAAALT